MPGRQSADEVLRSALLHLTSMDARFALRRPASAAPLAPVKITGAAA